MRGVPAPWPSLHQSNQRKATALFILVGVIAALAPLTRGTENA